MNCLAKKVHATIAFLVAYFRAYFGKEVHAKRSFWVRLLIAVVAVVPVYVLMSLPLGYCLEIDLTILTDVIGPLITLAVVGMIFKKIKQMG